MGILDWIKNRGKEAKAQPALNARVMGSKSTAAVTEAIKEGKKIERPDENMAERAVNDNHSPEWQKRLAQEEKFFWQSRAANDDFSAADRALIEASEAGWEELGFKRPRTEKDNLISYAAEGESRTQPDGTEKQVHIGWSTEGYHAAVRVEDPDVPYIFREPCKWGKAHSTVNEATEDAWKNDRQLERLEGNKIVDTRTCAQKKQDAELDTAEEFSRQETAAYFADLKDEKGKATAVPDDAKAQTNRPVETAGSQNVAAVNETPKSGQYLDVAGAHNDAGKEKKVHVKKHDLSVDR